MNNIILENFNINIRFTWKNAVTFCCIVQYIEPIVSLKGAQRYVWDESINPRLLVAFLGIKFELIGQN